MNARYYAYLTIALLALLLTPSLSKMMYTEAPKQCDLTHEEAMLLCDALDMVYDPEAEGYTTTDFCYPTMD